jgi:hypothetical protein
LASASSVVFAGLAVGQSQASIQPLAGKDVASAKAVGVWVHIAGVYDGKAWLLYRNGRLEASQTDSTGAVLVRAPWYVGAASPGNGRYFNGSIDDVRLYDRALTAAGVASLAEGI